MALTLTQTATATAVNCQVSFLAVGGTGPYVYSVVTNGAGGMINSSTGVYIAPPVAPSLPQFSYDTIVVVDSLGARTSSQVLVGSPLLLVCDILQRELGLAPGRVYLWDQKIMQPTDDQLYIAVAVPSCRAFANSAKQSSSGVLVTQSANMFATLDIDAISRGPAARDRKEEIVMALGSIYAEQQQDANSFMIGKLPVGFTNISDVDGAAIPYRYRISVNIQYTVSKAKPLPYLDDFSLNQVINS